MPPLFFYNLYVLGLLEFCRPAVWSAPFTIVSFKNFKTYYVDKQSTLVERQSNTTSNCRYYDNLRCFQNGMGCFHGNPDDRRQVVAQEHINVVELKAAFFALKSFLKDKINKVICLKLDNTTAPRLAEFLPYLVRLGRHPISNV